jgi:superfamily II DNA or RNA helicase
MSTEPRTFLLDVPFALRAAASAAGATWDTELKAHVFRGVELPRGLRAFGAPAYSLESARELELNEEALPAREPLGGLEPRPHQREAIKAILRAERAERCGFLLADDVGLGKTVSALKAALHLPEIESILIVCPLGVISHWRQTILHLGDQGRRVVVLNYDRLARLFEAPPPAASRARAKKKRKVSKRTRNKRLAAKGELTMAFDCVIFDESHKLRNVTTQRARLAAKVQQAAAFTIWASATAGEDPLRLAYLAPLLAQATRSKVADLAEYEAWCETQGIGVTRGAYGQWSWDRESPTASEDLERVRRWLFEGIIPVGIRRRPEDIAGWPEVQRVPMPVALDSDAQELYDEEWRAFRKAMQLGGRTRKDRGNALVARLRFRQKASLLRVPGTIALAEDLLENGRQVAISVEFRETQEAIRAGMEKAGHSCAVIHGEQSATEREKERLRFQRGQAPVVVYTVTEAISLHAGDALAGGNPVARANILSDPRYSAIACAQIEGRCHRDGQHATVYYMFAEDTIEEEIVQTVIGRLRTMKTMIGDDTETLQAIEALLAGERMDEALEPDHEDWAAVEEAEVREPVRQASEEPARAARQLDLGL